MKEIDDDEINDSDEIKSKKRLKLTDEEIEELGHMEELKAEGRRIYDPTMEINVVRIWLKIKK